MLRTDVLRACVAGFGEHILSSKTQSVLLTRAAAGILAAALYARPQVA